MDSYYNDPDKITFDRAEMLVERYIREERGRRAQVEARDVAREYDLPASDHNVRRIHDALDEKLERIERSSTSRTAYKL